MAFLGQMLEDIASRPSLAGYLQAQQSVGPWKGWIVTEPKDVLKSPYVLVFLGLEERPSYSESDLGLGAGGDGVMSEALA